jgi:hypothetical protein
VTRHTDNHRVIAHRRRQPALALLLMVATASATALPPSHIHFAADHDHHHAAAIEHAHWAGHFELQPAFDDNDHGGVLFVDHPAVSPAPYVHIAPPPAAIVARLASHFPARSPGIARYAAGNAVRDGPILLPFSLRGPPFVL